MRHYDITERIKKRNQLPTVTIFDRQFEVRAKMTNFLVVMHEAKELENVEGKDANEMKDKIYSVISHTLGLEAVEYIQSLDLTVEATIDIMFTAVQMINGTELSDDLDEEEETETEKKLT